MQESINLQIHKKEQQQETQPAEIPAGPQKHGMFKFGVLVKEKQNRGGHKLSVTLSSLQICNITEWRGRKN